MFPDSIRSQNLVVTIELYTWLSKTHLEQGGNRQQDIHGVRTQLRSWQRKQLQHHHVLKGHYIYIFVAQLLYQCLIQNFGLHGLLHIHTHNIYLILLFNFKPQGYYIYCEL